MCFPPLFSVVQNTAEQTKPVSLQFVPYLNINQRGAGLFALPFFLNLPK